MQSNLFPPPCHYSFVWCTDVKGKRDFMLIEGQHWVKYYIWSPKLLEFSKCKHTLRIACLTHNLFIIVFLLLEVKANKLKEKRTLSLGRCIEIFDNFSKTFKIFYNFKYRDCVLLELCRQKNY